MKRVDPADAVGIVADAMVRSGIEPEPADPQVFNFRLLRDMRKTPPKKGWLIKGIFALGETSAWIAPPGRLKSSLLAEAAFVIASNTPDWHGYKIKRTGAVIYFALERVGLVERRLLAYAARGSEESDDPPIAVEPGIKDLMDPAIVDHIIAIVRAVERVTGQPVVMMIIDTFAKAIAAGGGDEDKAKDQGKVFANLQRLKDSLGGGSAPHMALVGHTGKDESRGARGSNAILGDVDLMVEITGDIIKTANAVKSNDGEEGPLFSFKGEVVVDRIDEDGEPERITIISQEDVSAQPATKDSQSRLTENQEAMLRLLRDAGPAGLSGDDWNAKAREVGIGVNRRSILVNLKGQLKDRNLIREYNGTWHVQK
jgi:hypothetical protein